MRILPGRMHSCRAQHPVPFVSTSSTSLKLCGTYATPSFTPPPSFCTLPLGIQHIPEPPIAPVRKWYQGACHSQQPCPTMNQVFMMMYMTYRQHYLPGYLLRTEISPASSHLLHLYTLAMSLCHPPPSCSPFSPVLAFPPTLILQMEIF